jgi:hypothetical protein
MIEQLTALQDQAWSLYCKLSAALENDIFTESAARRGQTSSIADQTLTERQKRLAAACRRSYARYERRTDALYS